VVVVELLVVMAQVLVVAVLVDFWHIHHKALPFKIIQLQLVAVAQVQLQEMRKVLTVKILNLAL
jgi:hypothetical protein